MLSRREERLRIAVYVTWQGLNPCSGASERAVWRAETPSLTDWEIA